MDLVAQHRHYGQKNRKNLITFSQVIILMFTHFQKKTFIHSVVNHGNTSHVRKKMHNFEMS